MTPPRTTRSITDLPNELLIAIVQELDPPSAACLGLTSHAHMVLVEAASRVSFRFICPQTAAEFDLASKHLRSFIFSDEHQVYQEWTYKAIAQEFSNDTRGSSATIRAMAGAVIWHTLSFSHTELVRRLLRDGFLASGPNQFGCMKWGHLRKPEQDNFRKSLLRACIPCSYIEKKQSLKARATKAANTKREKRVSPAKTRVKRTQWYCEDMSELTVTRSAILIVESKPKTRKAS